MSHAMSSHPRRWFIYSLIGLFLFLCLAITLAAILLLRRGRLPRVGQITGSSMEPILQGPRFSWTCPSCFAVQEFAMDTCISNQPFACQCCKKIDMQSAVDFNELDIASERIRPGDQVRFATPRMVRATRALEIASGMAHASGLRRGDVVVFQESLDAKREIKRLVGFASEHIAIEAGDLFVNHDRWCKSLEQSLRQSVLINAWERSNPSKQQKEFARSNGTWTMDGEYFEGVLNTSSLGSGSIETSRTLQFEPYLPGYISNAVGINAHDSHVVIPVTDFGFAFQLSHLENPWKIECELRSPVSRPRMAIELENSSLTLKSGDQAAHAELLHRKDRSIWIVVAMVDGHLIAGSQEEEWLRMKLPLLKTDVAENENGVKPPIEMTAVSGSLAIDQLLVFRDIYYRGNGDSATQSWEPNERIVVLGDNVSASSDSRDRWPDGLPPNSAKGVLIQTESPMEVLLRQR